MKTIKSSWFISYAKTASYLETKVTTHANTTNIQQTNIQQVCIAKYSYILITLTLTL